MEILQLIFSVIAGLGAGALAALFVVRRDEQIDHDFSVSDRLRELEHQTELDRRRLDHLAESSGSDDRDLRKRMQGALLARDERFDALIDRLQQLERSVDGSRTNPSVPPRLIARIDEMQKRIETIEMELSRREQQLQSKLISFRETTHEVIRRLAEHQVGEAERLTKLTRKTGDLEDRIESIDFTHTGDTPSTTAALVEVLETQVALNERAGELETRIDKGLRDLDQHLADVETRLLTIDELQGRVTEVQRRAAEDDRILALQGALADLENRLAKRSARLDVKAVSLHPPSLDNLERIYGIGPKLAAQLADNGVKDIQALAELKGDDIARLSKTIRGFRDRQARHDWIGQAKKLVAQTERAPEATAPPPWPAPADPDSIH